MGTLGPWPAPPEQSSTAAWVQGWGPGWGSRSLWPFPEDHNTPALYALLAHRSRSQSGVGDLGGGAQSPRAPAVSALGRGLVSGCMWCGGRGMNKRATGFNLCMAASCLSLLVPVTASSQVPSLLFSKSLTRPPPTRLQRQDSGQAGWSLAAEDEVMPGSRPWRRVRGVVWSRG